MEIMFCNAVIAVCLVDVFFPFITYCEKAVNISNFLSQERTYTCKFMTGATGFVFWLNINKHHFERVISDIICTLLYNCGRPDATVSYRAEFFSPEGQLS